MAPFQGLRQAWRWSVRTALRRWVKATVKPDDAAAEVAALAHPVCYVLENESQTDLAVLYNACLELHLPPPSGRLSLGDGRTGTAYLGLHRRMGFLSTRSTPRAPRYLTQLVAAAAAQADFDLDLVPVAIFWGRAPNKEPSLWRMLFADDWALVGRFKRLLNVLFNGHNTLVYFGDPIRLRDALEEGLSKPRSVRRILRALRTALRAQRVSTIGPDLSHRRTLVAHILNTRDVRRAVRTEMQSRAAAGRPLKRRAAMLLARKYALEIAANYSQPFITFMALVLGHLWNRLYDGVEFEHVENLRAVGDGAEIIYVPCHRSHMDYLLLSYVVYRKGFAVPHIAAGINLNLPLIGRFLRKGGAFFLRRTFKGNALYAVVFGNYLSFMMERGHPLEYFIEGGRSRTGRLLAPRAGMLAMTVRSFVRHPKRPVVFIPVYFGYERIAEGRTYIGELSGRPKEKESLAGLVRAAASVLRKKFGKVHVNLGAPIVLREVLEKHNPGWREADSEEAQAHGAGAAADWMSAAIGELGISVLAGINAAAAVTPVNLIAMVMLATPRQSIPEAVLCGQLELYRELLRLAPYGPLVTVSTDDGATMIRYAQSMGMITRQAHPLGDIMRMDQERAVLATYYRNNVLHLFAMPSLIACGFIGNATMRTADLKRLVWRVYPYIASELFLRWEESETGAVVDTLLDAFVQLKLLEPDENRSEWRRPLPTSFEAVRLSLLAESTIQTLERYYLVVALLLQARSGMISPEALEERCYLMAQRISVLYGLNSPEFFDKTLFRNFIELLRRRNVVQTSEAGNLLFGDSLLDVAVDAQVVLSERIRHSILQVTLGQPGSEEPV
jgi:glycerol-3-phosphate O-acyltransferase